MFSNALIFHTTACMTKIFVLRTHLQTFGKQLHKKFCLQTDTPLALWWTQSIIGGQFWRQLSPTMLLPVNEMQDTHTHQHFVSRKGVVECYSIFNIYGRSRSYH